MSNIHAGKKITADEYFPRQKDAENTCRRKIERLIIQSVIFFALFWFFLVMADVNDAFFIVWYMFAFISIFMSGGSLLMISKAIRYYKFSLERIVEYMLSGGIVIEIPKEDYEKFDLFKTRKKKYKAKSMNRLKKDELKRENDLKKADEQREYEKKVEEEFQKQYFSDENTDE